jgi:hypothetical protein
MKRFLLAAIVCAATCAFAAPAAFAGNGNGAPSGPHFDLNIHGVANGQGFSGQNQNEIFVPLVGSCKINLVQNPLNSSFTDDFQVLQPDCVNNTSAEFSLPAPCAINPSTSPNPGLCSGTTTYYSVWARALGTPGGKSTAYTCATDPTITTGSQTVCSLNALMAVRGTGGSKFADVSSCLLFLTTLSATNKVVATPIFSQNYQNYFWQYTNDGLRLLQLRFYQVPSNVPTTIANCT